MKKILRHLRLLAFIASFVLFVYMLQRSGPEAVLVKIRLLGWGFAFLILLSGARHLLRAVAWTYCVQTDGRRPDTLDLFGPRLVGEALDDLTPAGPLLGETAKIAVVSRLIRGQAGASSVVIENLVYSLAAGSFMLSGLVLALLKLATPVGLRWISGEMVICFLASIGVAWLILSRRILLLARTLDYLKRAGVEWAFLERHQHYLRAVEQAIYDFFLTRGRIFLAVLGIEFATNFTGVGEAYIVLKVTASHASLFAAYLAESASRAAQFAFCFIPFGLGVQEGVAAATLGALGYPATEGVSLAIIRKIRTLFWTALGLLLAAKYSIARPAEERSYEATHCQRRRFWTHRTGEQGHSRCASRGHRHQHDTHGEWQRIRRCRFHRPPRVRPGYWSAFESHGRLTGFASREHFHSRQPPRAAALESPSPASGHHDPAGQSGRGGNGALAANYESIGCRYFADAPRRA